MTVASETLQHTSGGARPLIRSWFFIVTLLTAFVAWIMALTGQTIVSVKIAQTKIPKVPSTASLPPGVTLPPGFTLLDLPSFFPVTSTPGILWFALIVQSIVFFQLVSALYSNTIRTHTPLLTTFAAIVIVLAAIGVDNNLFSPASSQKLTAAAWMMTAIVDCLWVLALTAGDGTRTRRMFDYLIGGSGLFGSRARVESTPMFETSKFTSVLGRVPGSRLRRSQRKAHVQVGSPKGLSPNFDKPGDEFVAAPPPSEGTRTSKSQRGSTVPSAMASVVGDGTRASIVSQPEDQEKDGSATAKAEKEKEPAPVVRLKAMALYPYTGVPDDPNELSFKKGEVLEILDKTGKWWEARKEDGTEGMVPSNYMRVI